MISGPSLARKKLLETWKREDESISWDVMTHRHKMQREVFLSAVVEDRELLVNGEAGRSVVELFTALSGNTSQYGFL
jgi:hypothetical protein